MADHRRPRMALLALLGMAGVVLGHEAGYRLAYPGASHRTLELAHSGHSYWEAAVALAICGTLSALLGEFVGALRRSDDRRPPHGFASAWARLAVGQLLVFATLEIGERWVHGVPIDVWTKASFWAALPVLVLIAALGAALMRTARRLGEALRRDAPPHTRGRRTSQWPRSWSFAPPSAPSLLGLRPRAPPSAIPLR